MQKTQANISSGAPPERHLHFIENSVPRLKEDARILGVAIGGSFLLGEMDEFSDLDLVVYIDPRSYKNILTERALVASKMGSLLEHFTGEHVGEPRLLICLYGPPLLHVDLKFVSLDDIHDKVENPIVLWEREDVISSQVYLNTPSFPQPDPVWIEKRFWIWVHYTATKIGRGELFEAVESINFLRVKVLGPLILQKHGARPQGLRKLEFQASQSELKKLRATLAGYDPLDCIRALEESIDLYKELRQGPEKLAVEELVLDDLSQLKRKLK